MTELVPDRSASAPARRASSPSPSVPAATGWWAGAGERLRSGGWFAPVVLVLACLYPFLAFAARNRGEAYDAGRVVVAFVVTLAVVALVQVVASVLVPRVDGRQLALALGAAVLCFFSYGPVFGHLDRARAVRLFLWLLVSLALVAGAYVFGSRSQVRFFLTVALAVAVGLAGVEYVAAGDLGGSARVEPEPSPGAALEPVGDPPDERPNVYWLIFDEYGRADQLEANHGIDNSDMVEALEERGFLVTDDGYTSYPVTSFSIATVMNMDYVVTDEESFGSRPGEEAVAARERSAVGDRFAELGYRHLYSETGVYLALTCDDDHVDVCLEQEQEGPDLEEVDLALLELTPFGESSVFTWPRGDPVTIVEQALADREQHGEPVFVRGHVLSPHDPHWYTEDCELRDVPIRGADEERYANELRCLNERILAAVDLIEQRDPGAIVVLQSDHGAHPLEPPGRLDTWTDAALYDRFSVFEAWRLPEGCEGPEPGVHLTVNTFRVVFGCIERREHPPIEHRYFMWRYEEPDVVEEIHDPPWEVAD